MSNNKWKKVTFLYFLFSLLDRKHISCATVIKVHAELRILWNIYFLKPGFVIHPVNLNGKFNTVSLDSVMYKAADLSLSVIPSEVSQTPSSTGTTLACQAETDKY